MSWPLRPAARITSSCSSQLLVMLPVSKAVCSGNERAVHKRALCQQRITRQDKSESIGITNFSCKCFDLPLSVYHQQ